MNGKSFKTLGRVTHTYSYRIYKLNNCNDIENKNRTKNENGITLIALIVTIVVLIILAGISIGAIVGDNGIISKSKEAKEEAGTVGLDLQLEKQTDTSIIATANATDTKSEIISYTFYIRKITENDSAYVMIKKSDKLTKAVTCSNLEKDMGYKVKLTKS